MAVVVRRFVFVVGGIVHVEDAKSVFDGNPRCHQQEIIAKAGVLTIFLSVEIVVQYEGGHYNGLTRTGGHFEAETGQVVVRLLAYFLRIL